MHFFQIKIEKNWKRINEKLHSQKQSADDFKKVHLFMKTMTDNLKTHFKLITVNIATISEEYQKKFLLEFKTKKSEELKQILDSE